MIFLILFSVFAIQKVAFNENIRITDHASGIRLLDYWKSAINWKNNTDVIICRHNVIVNIFNVIVFFLSSLFTGSSFLSVSLLVLKIWLFLFIRDWPETRELEIAPSKFHRISEDWNKLETLNLIGMFAIESLQNTRFTAFTVSELLNWKPTDKLGPSAFFHHKMKAKKRPWNTSNTWLKLSQIKGMFFRIN